MQQLRRHVSRTLVDGAQHLAGWLVRTAAGPQRTDAAVVHAGAVTHEAFWIDAKARPLELAPVVSEFLTVRVDIEVALVVVGEVGAAEGATATLQFVEYRDVRLDTLLVDQPA